MACHLASARMHSCTHAHTVADAACYLVPTLQCVSRPPQHTMCSIPSKQNSINSIKTIMSDTASLSVPSHSQMLRALYFRSDDPHLSSGEVKRLLLCLPEHKRAKLCAKLKRSLVKKVGPSHGHLWNGGSCCNRLVMGRQSSALEHALHPTTLMDGFTQHRRQRHRRQQHRRQ